MHHFSLSRRPFSRGFTFVEILIVAPIVILVIGAFITVIVGMTGDVLASRANNVLDYNIQDALNRIQDDVRLSTTYLPIENISLTANTYAGPGGTMTTSPQGYNDSTGDFTNVGSNGTMLILNTLATANNPIASTGGLIYEANQPNGCSDPAVSQNTPLSLNVVYFLKTTGGVTSLWRRTIAPPDYLTSGCATPWQQPSCTPGYTSPFCQTQDILLVSNVTSFNVDYFATSSSTTPNTVANNSSNSASVRGAAMQGCPTVNVTITASQVVAGRTITQAASLRATRLDSNASTIATTTAATIPAAPTVSGTVSGSDSTSATFTWPRVQGATSYNLNYNINGGSWITGLSASTALTYTVQGTRNQPVNVEVSATNTAGTSSYATATVTIPLFTPLLLQNGWSDYNQGFASSAYTKTSSGLVVLKGLIKGGTATADTNIAILPVGYRPANTLMFAVSTNSTTGRLDIRPDGTVRFEVGSNAWFNLDGVNFMPSGTTFTAITPPFANSWVNYVSSPYSNPLGYTQASDGRVSLEGLVSGGTVTANAQIAALPASIAPAGFEHMAVLAGNGFGILGISPAAGPGTANSLLANALGTNAYDSTQAMFYPYTYGGYTVPTLQNSWVAYGSTYATPGYTKSADGMVLLNGLIKSGTVTSGTVIETLPVGYRPSAEEIFLTPSNGAWGRVDVLPNGNVVTESVSNAWVSLDTIAFMPEQ